MSTHYKTAALVFKKEDRGEADRLFTVLSYDFGRIEVFGKAIRKIASKLRGGMELGMLSDIEFVEGKNRKTLVDASTLQSFKNIKESPEKMAVASFAFELLDTCIKGQESDEALWNFVKDFFENLNAYLPITALAQDYFFWNVISLLGYRPELARCVVCQSSLHPEQLYFSCKEGGVMCASCVRADAEAKKISVDALKVLRFVVRNDYATMLKLKAQDTCLQLLAQVSCLYQEQVINNRPFKP